MNKLKEIRMALGMTQSEMAMVINTGQTSYSQFENGVATPILEDMCLYEKKFKQRIDWNDKLSVQQKAEITAGILTLCEYYPVMSVLVFCQKALREGQRMDDPAILIRNYANIASRIVPDVEPLLPTGIKTK
jgi:transcriptional regulator with XRE-family HTH domain